MVSKNELKFGNNGNFSEVAMMLDRVGRKIKSQWLKMPNKVGVQGLPDEAVT